MSSLVAIILAVFVLVLTAVVLIAVSFWKIFVKAGQKGWESLVPLYSYVKLLEMVNKPLWWILLSLVPIANIYVALVVARRLAAVFGKGAWFTVGLICLPFIFYPILAFGKSQYVNKYAPATPMSEAVKWAWIATGATLTYMTLFFMIGLGASSSASLQIIPSTGGYMYATDGNYVYLDDKPIYGADAYTFELIPGTDYATDFSRVFFAGERLYGEDSDSFKVLDAYYAVGKKHVYYAGEVVDGADSATFTLMGAYYAKDAERVYIYGAEIEADVKSFKVLEPDYGYGADKDAVYFDGDAITGADIASFEVEEGDIGSISYDALDKNHYYYYGAVVK